MTVLRRALHKLATCRNRRMASKRGASVEPTQGPPKRRRLLSPAPLSIPLQVWTPAQVKDAMLLQKDVPDGVAQIFQGMVMSDPLYSMGGDQCQGRQFPIG